MSWILTYTGRQVDLESPSPFDITLTDIAQALSHISRFTGHTERPYTVAQHSVHVAELVSPLYRAQALLHDATEAYLGDVSTPLKALLPGYRALEDTMWRVLCQRFKIDPVMAPEVKHADLQMLGAERRDLMAPNGGSWECLEGILLPDKDFIDVREPWPAEVARGRFLEMAARVLP